MSDNTQLPGSGAIIATDEISGVMFQRVKLVHGSEGVNQGDIAESNPFPVKVLEAILPVGASTEATLTELKQALDLLSAKITACNTGEVALDASTLAALETVTAAVSGTVAISNFPVTQLVSGSVTVSNLPSTQTVAGTVAVSNLPATQAISGTVAVSNLPATQTVSGSVVVSNFPENTSLTNTELRAEPVSVQDSLATTLQQSIAALNDSILYMASAILDKMPVLDRTDRVRVDLTDYGIGGSVYAISNVNACANISGTVTYRMFEPWNFSDAGSARLYQQIIVS